MSKFIDKDLLLKKLSEFDLNFDVTDQISAIYGKGYIDCFDTIQDLISDLPETEILRGNSNVKE